MEEEDGGGGGRGKGKTKNTYTEQSKEESLVMPEIYLLLLATYPKTTP